METRQGQLQEKTEALKKDGSGKYLKLVVDGKKYNYWKDVRPEIGDWLKMTGSSNEKDGRTFWNVDEIEVIDKPESVPEEGVGTAKAPQNGSKYDKDPVGLAVEVFMAMVQGRTEVIHSEAMEQSIKLVKQAQSAFN